MPFRDSSSNLKFISGIHNYCDRWCERCHFTERCEVYAAEEANPDDGSSRIYDLRLEAADSIQPLLFQLDKMRSETETEFPNARDFVRPGFDEPTLDVLH